MPANMGIARRMEAANRRIDAAVASLAPDAPAPDAGRNRGFAEVVRAEWLADTLEGLAGDGASDGDDLDGMSIHELRDLAADKGIEGRSGMKKADLIEALRDTE